MRARDIGGSAAVDGSFAEPLVPGVATKPGEEREDAAVPAGLGSEDGRASGRWSDRWVWTAAGGLLAAPAGVGGYALTRGTGRPSRVPPA